MKTCKKAAITTKELDIPVDEQDIRLLPASENKLATLTDELAQDSSSHSKITNGIA